MITVPITNNDHENYPNDTDWTDIVLRKNLELCS